MTLKEELLKLIDDWIILQVEEGGLGQFTDDIGSPKLAEQIIAHVCQPDKDVVEIIDQWQKERFLAALGGEELDEEHRAGWHNTLAARLEAHWNARPERWYVSADTLRKLREARDDALARAPTALKPYGWRTGFDAAIGILGLMDTLVRAYEAITKEEVHKP